MGARELCNALLDDRVVNRVLRRDVALGAAMVLRPKDTFPSTLPFLSTILQLRCQ